MLARDVEIIAAVVCWLAVIILIALRLHFAYVAYKAGVGAELKKHLGHRFGWSGLVFMPSKVNSATSWNLIEFRRDNKRIVVWSTYFDAINLVGINAVFFAFLFTGESAVPKLISLAMLIPMLILGTSYLYTLNKAMKRLVW